MTMEIVQNSSQSDSRMLSMELTNEFPEVPPDVIKNIMEMNLNNRELCINALNRECQRYQHHLYGPPPSDNTDETTNHSVVTSAAGISRTDIKCEAGQSYHAVGLSQISQESPMHLPNVAPVVFYPPQTTYSPPHISGSVFSPPLSSLASSVGKSPQSITSPSSSSNYSSSPSLAAQSREDTAIVISNEQSPHDGSQIKGSSGISHYHPYSSVGLGLGPTGLGHSISVYADRPCNYDPHSLWPQVSIPPNQPFMNPTQNIFTAGRKSPMPMTRTNDSPQNQQFMNHTQNMFTPGRKSPLPMTRPNDSYYQYLTGIPNSYSHNNLTPPLIVSSFPLPSHSNFQLNSGSRENNVIPGDGNLVIPSVFESPPTDFHPPSGQLTKTSRPGSLSNEDLAYNQALIISQTTHMEYLKADLIAKVDYVHHLRSEVIELQKDSLDRHQTRNNSFPTAEDLQKLRSENYELQVDIRLFTFEIDLANNGQTPLGWLDSGDQRFHDVIRPGQSDIMSANLPLPPPPSSSALLMTPLLPGQDVRPTRPLRPPPPPPSARNKLTKPVDSDEGERWNCSACTFLNHPLLDKCECCEMPKIPMTASTLRS